MRKMVVAQITIALVLNVVGLVSFVGCSKKVVKKPPENVQEQVVDEAEYVEQKDPVVMKFAEEPPVDNSGIDYVVVQFEFDSYELTGDSKRLIDLLGIKDGSFDLVGGACPIGDEPYNHNLGMQRALAVLDYLVENGVFDVAWKSVGEKELVSNDPDTYYLNRRCEIIER